MNDTFCNALNEKDGGEKMLLTVKVKELSDALKKARKATAPHAPLDVLSGFLLVAKGSTLMVVGTNLEWAVAVKVRAEVKQEGRCVVDAKTLTEVVALFAGEVELSTVARIRNGEQKPFLKVAADGRESIIPLLAEPDDFPLPRRVDGSKTIVDGNALKEAIEDVAVALSTQESRPALMGILFEVYPQSHSMSLVATDGFRMALREVPIGQTEISSDMETFLLPGASLKKWASLKPEGAVVVQVEIKSLKKSGSTYVSRVAFRTRGVSAMFTVVDEKFPKYKEILVGAVQTPKAASFQADSKEFLDALKALKPVVPPPRKRFDPFNPVDLVVMRVNGSIDLSVSGPKGDAATSFDGDIRKDDGTEEVQVGFRWKYLADVVKRAAKRNLPVELQIPDPKHPIYARLGEGYDYLFMPMNLP